MARPDVAHRTSSLREGRRGTLLSGPLAYIPELLAIGGLVAVVALVVSALT